MRLQDDLDDPDDDDEDFEDELDEDDDGGDEDDEEDDDEPETWQVVFVPAICPKTSHLRLTSVRVRA